MQKNEIFTAPITGCTSEGMGVARHEDRAVFIKGAIPGEVCTVRIVKVTKTAVYGRLEEVVQASPHRMKPICPHFGRCGGCDYMHMDYALESELKRQRVADALKRIGGVDPEPMDILAAPTDAGYRNKAQFPVAMAEGKPAAGFFRARTHELIPVTHCHIQPETAERVSKAVLRWMEQYHILPYDEATGKGYIRHIFLRKGEVSGQIMVCLIANAEQLPKRKQLVAALREAVPEITTILHNVNTRSGNTILGETYHTLFGPGYIEDTLCGLKFRLSPASFYQVNHHQAEVLYREAISLADLHGNETVLDLYCGTGTITLAMAASAGQVIGVEVVPQAIEDAKENALRNGIENARFFCADAGEAAARLAAEGVRPDVITVDPPRKGLSPEVIDAMAQMNPRRIVYVSCDPATLARDVKLLTEKGYRFVTAKAVDLFPRTKHVESIVCLNRKTTHEMKLHASPFEKIKSGTKTIELRLYDEKRQKIKAGDDIIFTNTVNGEKMYATVKKLHRFNSFEELYKTLPLLQCGYTAEDVDTAHPSDMEQYYSAEEQKKYGVVGIELFPPKRMTDESVALLSK